LDSAETDRLIGVGAQPLEALREEEARAQLTPLVNAAAEARTSLPVEPVAPTPPKPSRIRKALQAVADNVYRIGLGGRRTPLSPPPPPKAPAQLPVTPFQVGNSLTKRKRELTKVWPGGEPPEWPVSERIAQIAATDPREAKIRPVKRERPFEDALEPPRPDTANLFNSWKQNRVYEPALPLRDSDDEFTDAPLAPPPEKKKARQEQEPMAPIAEPMVTTSLPVEPPPAPAPPQAPMPVKKRGRPRKTEPQIAAHISAGRSRWNAPRSEMLPSRAPLTAAERRAWFLKEKALAAGEQPMETALVEPEPLPLPPPPPPKIAAPKSVHTLTHYLPQTYDPNSFEHSLPAEPPSSFGNPRPRVVTTTTTYL
jgi:hypothetical protein